MKRPFVSAALFPPQNHSNEDIYEKAVAILESYFDVEDGEEENLAPAVAEGGAFEKRRGAAVGRGEEEPLSQVVAGGLTFLAGSSLPDHPVPAARPPGCRHLRFRRPAGLWRGGPCWRFQLWPVESRMCSRRHPAPACGQLSLQQAAQEAGSGHASPLQTRVVPLARLHGLPATGPPPARPALPPTPLHGVGFDPQ